MIKSKKYVVLMVGILSILIVQQASSYKANAAENLIKKNISRVQGANRLKTSMAIADELNTSKVDNIVLAYAYDFPDALSGSTLAKKLNAPLLIIGKLEDSKEVIDYITLHLSAKGNIYILGGKGVVEKNVEDSLISQGFNITRLAGENRIETNNAIIDKMDIATGTSVFIASDHGFADALSASGIAALNGFPIILTGKDSLDQLMKDQLTKIAPKKAYIVGGMGVISEEVKNQIKQLVPDATIQRLAGNNRYETSMNVYKEFNAGSKTVVMASGKNFPDALSGSLFAAKNNTSIVLADEDDFDAQKSVFDQAGVDNFYVLGGTGALSGSIEDSISFDAEKEAANIKEIMTQAMLDFTSGNVNGYMSIIDKNIKGYKDTKEVMIEALDLYAKNNVAFSVTLDSMKVDSINYKEAVISTVESANIKSKITGVGQTFSGDSTYNLRKIDGQWKIYNSKSLLNELKSE